MEWVKITKETELPEECELLLTREWAGDRYYETGGTYKGRFQTQEDSYADIHYFSHYMIIEEPKHEKPITVKGMPLVPGGRYKHLPTSNIGRLRSFEMITDNDGLTCMITIYYQPENGIPGSIEDDLKNFILVE